MFDESFDRGKSERTKASRGIDFVEARALWHDPESIEGPANTTHLEHRWLKVGRIGDKIWTVGFTVRQSGIRIFMVRPARDDERSVYLGN